MKTKEISRSIKISLGTLISSITFFYTYITLVMIALVPSSVRAYQMWNNLQTPIWLEGFVGLTRFLLFVLIFSLLTRSNIVDFKQKEFWDQISETCTKHLEKNWPYTTITQIFVFLIFLYGLGNLLIKIIANNTLIMVLDMFSLQSDDYAAATSAYIFFLKNMTIIPLTVVFFLMMCGVKHKKT